MSTTYADVQEGERLDIALVFVSRRRIRADDDDCLSRLLVADSSGTRFAVLATPDSGLTVGLRTGERYRFSGLLGASTRQSVDGSDTGGDCPRCGEPLRRTTVLDRVDPAVGRAARGLGLERPFGVVDEWTDVCHVDRDDPPAEEWIPADTGELASPAEQVCVSCGHHTADTAADSPGRDQQALSLSEAGSTTPGTGALAANVEPHTANFRRNVASGFVPHPAAIGDELLFAEHPAVGGDRTASDGLFAIRSGAAVTKQPWTGHTQRYVSVGLEATAPATRFRRPRLDVVVVLDISGSMDAPLGGGFTAGDAGRGETKLEAATGALCALADRLREGDRLGVVLCNDRAHVARPLRDATGLSELTSHTCGIEARGRADLASGLKTAVGAFDSESPVGRSERRVVVLTDARQSAGATSTEDLVDTVAGAVTRGIHTTVVGVGLDADPELGSALAGVRGGNHCSLPPGGLAEQLDCTVTPVAHDLTLELVGDGYRVAGAHGRPRAGHVTDRVVRTGTVFPVVNDGSVRGGPVLVRLEQTAPEPDAELAVSWTERGGGARRERLSVDLPDCPGSYTDDAVRTAVALARHGRALREWAGTCHERSDGYHEHSPVPLVVSDRQARRFEQLRAELETVINRTDETGLQREVDLLGVLSQQGTAPAVEAVDR